MVRKPGKTLDNELTIIEEDVDVYTMICDYEGLDVIELFVEKGQEPLQVVSPKRKHLVSPRVPVTTKQALTWHEMENISEEEMGCGDGVQDIGDEEMHNGDGDEEAADEDVRDEERDNRAWDEEDSDDSDYINNENDDNGSEDEDYESDESG
ncbi:nucleolar transcription factor 1-like [Camellia sinensis]|uniref:nucleolar transcription factor 1-like n=1 Tax=Camellia sinensis TaxID=4442 RepID=UPI001036C2A7|nr:nucleolar transcription factor 1-like [Camellia sinensis]